MFYQSSKLGSRPLLIPSERKDAQDVTMNFVLTKNDGF